MANRLREDYPEYFYRIISLYKQKHIPLHRDYYYFQQYHDEKFLTANHNRLKNAYRNGLEEKNVERKMEKADIDERTAFANAIFLDAITLIKKKTGFTAII